jgi:hypothetical protein
MHTKMRAIRLLLLLVAMCSFAAAKRDARAEDQPCAVSSANGTNTVVCNISKDALEALSKSLTLLPETQKSDIPIVLKDLGTKSYEELYAIQLSSPKDACSLIDCRNISGGTIGKLAEAILNARDKEQAVRTAATNNIIAISGAIIAILSFILSIYTTVALSKSKRSGSS